MDYEQLFFSDTNSGALTTVNSTQCNRISLKWDKWNLHRSAGYQRNTSGVIVLASTIGTYSGSIRSYPDPCQLRITAPDRNTTRAQVHLGFKRTGKIDSGIIVILTIWTFDFTLNVWNEKQSNSAYLPPGIVEPQVTFPPNYTLPRSTYFYYSVAAEHAYVDEGLALDTRYVMLEIGMDSPMPL